MDGCTDPKFESLLHPYELGMLPDTDRAEFEIHLTECDSCFQKALKLEAAAGLMKEDLDVRAVVREAAESGGEKGDVGRQRQSGKRWIRIVVPALAAAAVFLAFFLTDWRLEIGSTKEAVAAPNRLAIMYFENLADPDDSLRLGEMATALLITDLSESRFVNVLSRERLDDLLNLVGQESNRKSDPEIASEIARRAKAKWILQGSVPPATDQLLVNVEIVEAATGEVIATEQVACGGAESVFCVVDKLTHEIKESLALPDSALNEYDPPIAEITTNSPEAYQHYLAGIEYHRQFAFSKARTSLERALEYDSLLAMAYYYLVDCYLMVSKDKELITKAMKLSNKVGRKERLYIEARYASVFDDNLGAVEKLKTIVELYPEEKEAYLQIANFYSLALAEFDQAIYYYNKVIELDSLHRRAHCHLAYALEKAGEFDHALKAADNYIALAPDEANAYDTKSEIYAWNGMLPEAIEMAQKAVEVDSTYYLSWYGLGQLYLFHRDYARAESCFVKYARSPEKMYRSLGPFALALVPLYQGRFQRAIEVLDSGLAVCELMQHGEDPVLTAAANKALKVFIYEELGKLDSALALPFSGFKWHANRIRLLTVKNDLAAAEQATAALWDSLGGKDSIQFGNYWLARGCIDFAEGNFTEAINHFVKAKEKIKNRRDRYEPYIIAQIMLARAFLGASRPDDAVAEFEQLITFYGEGRINGATWSIKIHYWAAQAYEAAGRTQDAIKQYEEFLEYWGNGDPGINAVEDAKTRLAQLKTIS